MAFTEKLKLEIKKKSAFRCCRCHEVGIDIHHVIPQTDGGLDDFDNAAPLCQNCHDRFGANPEKRKEIKQMRDWWYEVVEEKYKGDSDKFGEINEIILKIQNNQDNNLQKLRNELLEKLEELKKNEPIISSKNVQQITGYYISATKLAKGVYANFHCGKCNHSTALLITDEAICPNCKTPIK